MNIHTNRFNLFLLAVAVVLFLIVFIIAIGGFFSPSTSTKQPPSIAPTFPSPTRGSPVRAPILQATKTPEQQGVFTVSFAKAPKPDIFTITLSTSPSQPPFSTKAVPFSTEFQEDGKLMVITTTGPLLSGNTYTLYVRLKSNNHIVVKHRYENRNGVLVIIDNN